MSRHLVIALFLGTLLVSNTHAATKTHVISLGKTTITKFEVGPSADQYMSLKVRPLYVDARLKEFTIGTPHDITDRLFVVRRAFRLNDNLPDESSATPRWQWQRGGWLLVDRLTGRISPINLPDFDTLVSAASWYRDYIAYCGTSDDGKKLVAMVTQLGRRKPVLKKALAEGDAVNTATQECSVPTWQRDPMRVTFESPDGKKQTFSIRGHAVDLVNDPEDDSENSD